MSTFENPPEELVRENERRVRREALRSAREQSGMTQSEVAYRAGISRSKLSLYENGVIELSAKELKKLENIISRKPGYRGLSKLQVKAILAGTPDPKASKAAERHRLLRTAGMTQTALAKEMGIYRSKIAEWANGNLELSASEESKLNEVLERAGTEKIMADPYFLLEQSRNSGRKLFDEVVRLQKGSDVQERYIDALEKYITNLKALVSAYEELDVEHTEKITELTKRLADTHDLLDLKTKEVLLRESIESDAAKK